MRKTLMALLFTVAATVLISAETHASQRTIENMTEKIETNELISESMTFEQMIESIARDYGISVNGAQEKIGYSDVMVKKAIQSKATYRILSQMFTVNSSYKPTMRFYCETSESGSFRAIKRIIEVNMIRGYNGLSKQFSGNVYVNLEDPNRIFYIVNGDFFNYGTTTWNAGVSIGVGKAANVKFGVNNGSNHYQYRYVESRVTF